MQNNLYYYDGHLELIKTLRSMGDLDELRKAREKMAEIFPLTDGKLKVFPAINYIKA